MIIAPVLDDRGRLLVSVVGKILPRTDFPVSFYEDEMLHFLLRSVNIFIHTYAHRIYISVESFSPLCRDMYICICVGLKLHIQ
jgi:hypothetical protein